jgi:hypothetical protein
VDASSTTRSDRPAQTRTGSRFHTAKYWNLKATYHNSYSYGVIQQSLYYSTIDSSPEVDCPSTNLQRASDLSPYYKF